MGLGTAICMDVIRCKEFFGWTIWFYVFAGQSGGYQGTRYARMELRSLQSVQLG